MVTGMDAQEALRFLATAGVEYAGAFAKTNPSVAETMLMRVQAAHQALATALAKEPADGVHPD